MATLGDILGGLGGIGGGIIAGQRAARAEQARQAALQMQQEFRRMQAEALAQQARDRAAAQSEAIAVRQAAERRQAMEPYLEALTGYRSPETTAEQARRGTLRGVLAGARAAGVPEPIIADYEARLQEVEGLMRPGGPVTVPQYAPPQGLAALDPTARPAYSLPREVPGLPGLSREEAVGQVFPLTTGQQMKARKLEIEEGAAKAHASAEQALAGLRKFQEEAGRKRLPGDLRLQTNQIAKLGGEITLNLARIRTEGMKPEYLASLRRATDALAGLRGRTDPTLGLTIARLNIASREAIAAADRDAAMDRLHEAARQRGAQINPAVEATLRSELEITQNPMVPDGVGGFTPKYPADRVAQARQAVGHITARLGVGDVGLTIATPEEGEQPWGQPYPYPPTISPGGGTLPRGAPKVTPPKARATLPKLEKGQEAEYKKALAYVQKNLKGGKAHLQGIISGLTSPSRQRLAKRAYTDLTGERW